jgi:hypothetical protein
LISVLITYVNAKDYYNVITNSQTQIMHIRGNMLLAITRLITLVRTFKIDINICECEEIPAKLQEYC